MKERFKVIAAVFIVMIQDNKILLCCRQNSGYADGLYSLPAGHVEAGESVSAAAIREAREEIGVEFTKEELALVHVRSDNANDAHRVHHFFRATTWSGEPKNNEPDKCSDLSWFSLDALPENMIPYVREVIQHIQDGVTYSEGDWI